MRDLTRTLGVLLGEGAAVLNVVPGSPADKAGIAPGAKVVAVDGRRYSWELLGDAIARARSSPAPIEILYETGDFFRTAKVDWHGGIVNPHLQRDPARPDLILEDPRAAAAAPRGGEPAEPEEALKARS